MLRYELYRSRCSVVVGARCGVGCTIVHLLLVTRHIPLGGVLVRGGSVVVVLEAQWLFRVVLVIWCWLTGLEDAVCCSPENWSCLIEAKFSDEGFSSIKQWVKDVLDGIWWAIFFVLGGVSIFGFWLDEIILRGSMEETLCPLPRSKNPVCLLLLCNP
jgi:hypothetical protein